jgi:hypothetical protein
LFFTHSASSVLLFSKGAQSSQVNNLLSALCH